MEIRRRKISFGKPLGLTSIHSIPAAKPRPFGLAFSGRNFPWRPVKSSLCSIYSFVKLGSPGIAQIEGVDYI